MILNDGNKKDCIKAYMYLIEAFRNQEHNNSKIYIKFIFNDGKKRTYYKRDINKIYSLIIKILYERYYDIRELYIGVFPRRNKRRCAGISFLAAEVTVIDSRYLPLDFKRLCTLPCIREIPPSFIVQVSTDRLLLIWCLEEFWPLTPENDSLVNQFFEKFKILQGDFYGFHIEPVIDFGFVIPMPGFINVRDSNNPFCVRIFDYIGTHIVSLPVEITDDHDVIMKEISRYSIERFLAFVGLANQSYADVLLKEIDSWDGLLPESYIRRTCGLEEAASS